MRQFIASMIAVFVVTGTGSAYAGQEKSANKERPSQASVASKGAFGTVKASDAKVKGAKPATDLKAAKALTGKSGAFVGTVTKVFAPKSNSVVLLNFAQEYKTALVGAIDDQDFAKLPDLAKLKGKKVLLTGKVVDFKGQPQIQIDSPDDVRLVE